MKYACLIYADESDKTISPDPGDPGLEDVEAAELRDGEVLTTDGPFAETKEQLGGFYILECETLDEAIKWAAQIPHAATGTVEVRPVPNFE